MTRPDATPPSQGVERRAQRSEPLGAYRRAVHIEVGDGWASGEIEDDVHHFRARLTHDGERILAADGWGVRTPWSVCGGSVDQLRTLEGLTLQAAQSLPASDRVQHCTHLFDVAVLAAAYAHKQPGFRRIYRVEAHHGPGALVRAELSRDGRPELAWGVRNGAIQGGPFDGVPIDGLAKHLRDVDPELREMALVLRRASHTSYARRIDLDAFTSSVELIADRSPVCYAHQAHRRPLAMRNAGTTRDFWGQGTWPLPDATPADEPDHGQG